VTVPKNAGAGECVQIDTVFYYRSLEVAELEKAIRAMLRRTTNGLGRVDAELRDRLLPALLVLREKVRPGHWQEFLRAHGLNPTQFGNGDGDRKPPRHRYCVSSVNHYRFPVRSGRRLRKALPKLC
jgi:hypothetical protein